jgi:hypothetical protein
VHKTFTKRYINLHDRRRIKRTATSQKGIVMNTYTPSNTKANFVYEADHINCILYVDVDSMKRAGQITSPEFAEFMKVKNALPGYKLETKEFPKKNKRTYGGLSIKVMQAFIIQHEETIDEAKESLKELNKAKAEGLLKGAAYSAAKSWFLKKYSNVYNTSALSKKDGKRDALINELLASVDEEIINPPVKMLKEGVVCNG